jgi:hypothetical protein
MASNSSQHPDQNYDGGFVECSEGVKFDAHTNTQDLVQASKYQQQRALAERLCRQTTGEYKTEILRHMSYVEVRLYNRNLESDSTHTFCSHEQCPTPSMSICNTIPVGQCDSNS